MFHFISDLDKTLIYSKQNNAVCVEYIDKDEITYMTPKAVNMFNQLKNKLNFIPCTLRDYNQTVRVNFIGQDIPEYMICDNGATIYKNGTMDLEYKEYIETNIVNKQNVINEYNKIAEFINANNITISKLRSNDNYFFLIIFKEKETANKWFTEINKITSDYFTLHLQGRKLYFIPNKLNKLVAVNYLKKHCNISNIITSGDSSVDVEFTLAGDKIILPKHACFNHKNALVTKNDGIKAGEEIIDIIYDIVK